METINETIIPIQAVHPTELIVDEIKARGISRKEMAARLGIQPSNFSRMISKKESITPQMANKLEGALDIPASMWLNMQAVYDRDVLEISKRDSEEREWAKAERLLAETINMPLLFKHLGISGYAFAKDRITCLYHKLGVNSVDEVLLISQPSGCFKKSEKIALEEKDLKAWIILAYAACFNLKLDNKYVKGTVDEIASDIASHANEGTITEAYIRQCLVEHGIGYSYVPKLDKAPVDAYSSIINDVPYIVVSPRHHNMDMLVFDVLHELYHIDKDLVNGAANISCNGDFDQRIDIREMAANKYAEDKLIPKAVWESILNVQSSSISPYSVYNAVVEEAIKNGISPSIASWRYKYQTNIYNIQGYQSPKIH